MNISKLLAGVALAATVASGAHATVLFSDNFDAEHGGSSALNYAGFANWTVTGQVDLVKSPDYGIACSGSCVDLDGTSGPGAITSSSIAYNANQLLTISFDMSGNQRGGSGDQFDFNAYFGVLSSINNFQTTSGFLYGAPGNYTGLSDLGMYSETVAANKGFTTYSLNFTPTSAGTLKLYFGTSSADNVGPLVDNVLVTGGAVPEPATWAMMIAGFGMAGVALRRRRMVAA